MTQQFKIKAVLQFDDAYEPMTDQDVIDILREILANQDIKAAVVVEET